MKYLLDTRPFLWWCAQSAKLSPRVIELIKRGNSLIYISLVSIREIQVKSQLGKVDLPLPLLDIISWQNKQNNIRLLSIELHHMQEMTTLPNLHLDPMDRIQVAQAISENMTIITNDPNFSKYKVNVIW